MGTDGQAGMGMERGGLKCIEIMQTDGSTRNRTECHRPKWDELGRDGVVNAWNLNEIDFCCKSQRLV